MASCAWSAARRCMLFGYLRSACWRWGCSMRSESRQYCGVPKGRAGNFPSPAERLLEVGLHYDVQV